MTSTLRKLLALAGLTLGTCLAPIPLSGAEPPPPVPLWSGQAPGATGDSDEDRPALYPYLPAAGKNTGAAVLVCPGGGFLTRCSDHEGVLVAQWLQAHGIAGFVLRYRIGPIYSRQESLRDAQRALRHLRAHAAEYHLSPDRVGIIGFSAGAELASMTAAQALAAQPDAADPLDRPASRPDFAILAYGGSAVRETADVKPGTTGTNFFPPTFLFCTAEDAAHLNPMLTLYTALRQQRVPVEAHFFADGEHGVSLAQNDPVLGLWPELMFQWLRTGGWLTDRPRLAVHGTVKLDGEPLPHGSVIFTPLDSTGAPPVVAYLLGTTAVPAEFTLRPERGLVPGRYRVEVRQDAVRWQSNSRNPIMIRMTQKQRTGTLTEEDRREWNAYARQRQLSPAIEGPHVFTRQHPGDAQELVVEVKAGTENNFDIKLFSK
jgi:acetyl esterase/lipase